MNLRIRIIFIFTTLLPILSFSQNGSFTGMGNSSVMLYDYYALFNNQAGLSDIETTEVGFSYENSYLLWETSISSLGLVMPTKFGNFSFASSYYGYSDYSENNIGVGFARNLGKYFSLAIQFDYLFYSQSIRYGYKGALLFQTGFIAKPIDNLQIGFHVYNPGQVTLEDYNNEKVPTVIRFGLGYFFSEDILLTAETEKDIDNENRFKMGLQYEAIEHFFMRTGYLSNPNQFSFGLGYKNNNFTTDIAFTTHESLPISSQISFKYGF